MTASPNGLATRDDSKRKIINRLRRVEGQVRGLQKMIDEERDCYEILTLMAGIRSALNATGDLVLETYFQKCQRDMLDGKGDPEKFMAALKLSRR